MNHEELLSECSIDATSIFAAPRDSLAPFVPFPAPDGTTSAANVDTLRGILAPPSSRFLLSSNGHDSLASSGCRFPEQSQSPYLPFRSAGLFKPHSSSISDQTDNVTLTNPQDSDTSTTSTINPTHIHMGSGLSLDTWDHTLNSFEPTAIEQTFTHSSHSFEIFSLQPQSHESSIIQYEKSEMDMMLDGEDCGKIVERMLEQNILPHSVVDTVSNSLDQNNSQIKDNSVAVMPNVTAEWNSDDSGSSDESSDEDDTSASAKHHVTESVLSESLSASGDDSDSDGSEQKLLSDSRSENYALHSIEENQTSLQNYTVRDHDSSATIPTHASRIASVSNSSNRVLSRQKASTNDAALLEENTSIANLTTAANVSFFQSSKRPPGTTLHKHNSETLLSHAKKDSENSSDASISDTYSTSNPYRRISTRLRKPVNYSYQLDDSDSSNEYRTLRRRTRNSMKAPLMGNISIRDKRRLNESNKISKKKTSRSKTGCWTCRLRRKKCPEEKPNCSQCSRLGLRCDGYSLDRPPFMMEKEAQFERLTEIKEHTGKTRKLRIAKMHQLQKRRRQNRGQF